MTVCTLVTIACDCQERSKLSAEVAQVSALLEAGSAVRSSFFASGSYADIYQDLTDMQTDLLLMLILYVDFLSFLRLTLFSCTAYIYVDIAVWLLFWQESREQQRNFEEHAKTQAKSCWQLGKCKWQDCMCKTRRSAVYLFKLNICCLWPC